MSETGASGTIDSRMDIHQILEYLPHRYPILLVDRVLEVVPGERITALKNVSMNEPFFPGLWSSAVMAVHEDRGGRVWIGALGGLNVYERATGRLYKIAPRNGDNAGLAGDMVRSIHGNIVVDVMPIALDLARFDQAQVSILFLYSLAVCFLPTIQHHHIAIVI